MKAIVRLLTITSITFIVIVFKLQYNVKDNIINNICNIFPCTLNQIVENKYVLQCDKNNIPRQTYDGILSQHRHQVSDSRIERKLSGINDILVKCKSAKDSHARSHPISGNSIGADNNSFMSPVLYIQLTKNCHRFQAERGYVLASSTKEEAEFPIAFTILMYTDVEQTERLLRAIYRPEHVYCVHVDKKSGHILYKALVAIALCFDNVFVLQERVNVTWGTISVLNAELRCMSYLRTKKEWKYLINLTGQEFPLRTNYEIVQMLKQLNGLNVVYAHPSQSRWASRWQNASLSKLPGNAKLVKGSLHAILSQGFVDFVLHDPRASILYKVIESTSIPDEIFYPTLHYNPQLGAPGSIKGSDILSEKSQNLARYKVWKNDKKCCHGKYVRDVCIFGNGDLPDLTHAKEMFANKFHRVFEHSLDCIEEWHHNRTREQIMSERY